MKDKGSPLENLEHYTLDITKKTVSIMLKINNNNWRLK